VSSRTHCKFTVSFYYFILNIILALHHRLCGYQPFQAEDQAELIDEITHARFEFHERYWRNVSVEGNDNAAVIHPSLN
jgi:hypothetical protein